jgi:hypothetical protein
MFGLSYIASLLQTDERSSEKTKQCGNSSEIVIERTEQRLTGA